MITPQMCMGDPRLPIWHQAMASPAIWRSHWGIWVYDDHVGQTACTHDLCANVWASFLHHMAQMAVDVSDKRTWRMMLISNMVKSWLSPTGISSRWNNEITINDYFHLFLWVTPKYHRFLVYCTTVYIPALPLRCSALARLIQNSWSCCILAAEL